MRRCPPPRDHTRRHEQQRKVYCRLRRLLVTLSVLTELEKEPVARVRALLQSRMRHPRRVGTHRGEDGALRSELSRMPKAYRATYGVVVFDPSSGERLAMDADRRSLTLWHREHRIQRYSGWYLPLLDA